MIALSSSLFWASLGRTSEAPPAEPRAVIEQADSVVVGYFTGNSTPLLRDLEGQFEPDGRPAQRREAYSLEEFVVAEVVDGPPLPPLVSIEIVGGERDGVQTKRSFEPPAAGISVGLALLPVKGSKDRFIVVRGKLFAADTAAQLAAFKTFASETRAARLPTSEDELARDLELAPPSDPPANHDAPPPADHGPGIRDRDALDPGDGTSSLPQQRDAPSSPRSIAPADRAELELLPNRSLESGRVARRARSPAPPTDEFAAVQAVAAGEDHAVHASQRKDRRAGLGSRVLWGVLPLLAGAALFLVRRRHARR